MKTKIRILFALSVFLISTLSFSCVREVDSPIDIVSEKVALSLDTSISDAITRGFTIKESFSNGDEMRLFLTKNGSHDYYNPQGGNAKEFLGRYQNNSWSTNVYLEDEKANVYAYYPLEGILFNYNEPTIRFNLNMDRKDIFFGTHAPNTSSFVNRGNPHAKIQMKPAKAILEFYFRKTDYTGTGLVKDISLLNNTDAVSPCVPSEVTFNLITGQVKGENYPEVVNVGWSNSGGMIESISHAFPSKGYKVHALTTHPSEKKGDIKIRFTIDGKNFTWDVPAGTHWKSGYKYGYYVTLTSANMVFDEVFISKYEDQPKEDINL